MTSVIYSSILIHENLESVLSYRLAQKLNTTDMSEAVLNEIILDAYKTEKRLVEDAYLDIVAVKERDPACHRFLQPLLYYKGFLALQAYRVGNFLNGNGRYDFSYFLQMRSSEVFGVDIHPAATIDSSVTVSYTHLTLPTKRIV